MRHQLQSGATIDLTIPAAARAVEYLLKSRLRRLDAEFLALPTEACSTSSRSLSVLGLAAERLGNEVVDLIRQADGLVVAAQQHAALLRQLHEHIRTGSPVMLRHLEPQLVAAAEVLRTAVKHGQRAGVGHAMDMLKRSAEAAAAELSKLQDRTRKWSAALRIATLQGQATHFARFAESPEMMEKARRTERRATFLKSAYSRLYFKGAGVPRARARASVRGLGGAIVIPRGGV